jgi:hypothetical protein
VKCGKEQGGVCNALSTERVRRAVAGPVCFRFDDAAGGAAFALLTNDDAPDERPSEGGRRRRQIAGL